MLAAILISGRTWLLPAIVFLLVAILLLAWNYLRARADPKLRTACAALKLLGAGSGGNVDDPLRLGAMHSLLAPATEKLLVSFIYGNKIAAGLMRVASIIRTGRYVSSASE